MKTVKFILVVALSAVLFASCQTSQGCGCLHTDVQVESEITVDQA